MLSADIVRAESARYTTSLLCIPGLWSAPLVWRGFASYLAHRGWESQLLDVRAVDGGIATRAAAVAAHAAALSAPPVLIGHDVGGVVALAAAARAPAAAVVLLAPVVPGSAPARSTRGSTARATGCSPGRRGSAVSGSSTAGSSSGSASPCSSATRRRRLSATRTPSRSPSLGLRLEKGVQAALGLLPSRPTAAPLVAARERRPRARRAADARVALLEERVGRNAVPLEVVEGVLRRPRRERIHLVEPALVLLDDRDRGARRRLVASPAVDPGTHVREIAFERLHLVDVTAEVGIAGVEVETVALGELRPRHDRLELDEPQAEAGHDLVAIGE